MTPARLRVFAAIARHGSSREAAAELGVSEAAVSGHVSALRKELGDDLFTRTGSGISFTPGGLRLASRAVEMIGLQDQTLREVRAAGDGQRLLRIAVSSLFGEVAAPGLIELFSTRADDLQVEMSVSTPVDFPRLLASRSVDVTMGPMSTSHQENIRVKEFLRYQVIAVVGPSHALAGRLADPRQLTQQTWLLGPSAVDATSVASRMLRRYGVPEANQRIFQNHSAAVAEAAGGHGVALCAAHTVTTELGDGRLIRLHAPGVNTAGTWCASWLRHEASSHLVNELIRFVSTPRAMQAMLTGSGSNIARFRPRVHVTLWS
ncbi:MAG: DNA-binding transcriptional LysR family regulator [Ilumatobacter sp.]|jgi:DNA-binding transcriptional LysR family regulator